jgi:hydrogenase maturation protein HypF
MTQARRWLMGGYVQGVGYRAFVFNLARELGLCGVVQNLSGEVRVEAQGGKDALDAFGAALAARAPALARPVIVSCEAIPCRDLTGFEILPSAASREANIHVPPDNFMCAGCRRELLDPQDRRYRYPFINCTQCGPRYTLITAMPYDRPHTTMAGFALCPGCLAEYRNPNDRRFHAQPLACPACGPQLSFIAPHRQALGEAATAACIAALRRGEIVAVKGVGGYHLMCDARNNDAILKLRRNKNRPGKPLAVMFRWQGDDGLSAAREELQLNDAESIALASSIRPIVLVLRSAGSTLPETIAPGLNEIGAMLPYSPLHHLLLEDFGGPLIATSGNVSGEPVLTGQQAAELRLAKVAGAFLHHDRPIARPADDSVARVVAGKFRLMRVGRGIAPLEFDLPFALPKPLLAAGGHMKNSVALGWGRRAVLSPHIGDLESPCSMEVFEQAIGDLQHLYGVTAQALVADAHPGYGSSRWAAKQPLPLLRVQHHRAHASALSLEAGADKTLLCFTWDGAGLGDDGTLWGGEALLGRPGAWRRAASFRQFKLPGGERAAREPWRSAASLLWEEGLNWHSGEHDAVLLKSAWEHGLNAPLTSAAGRLFDAAASLLGLCDKASFEGEAPMLLEAIACGETEAAPLPLLEDESGLIVADWAPLLDMLLQEEAPVALRAQKFHASLASCIVHTARRVRERELFDAVGLTGGVFQNKRLAELAVEGLRRAGFEVFMPERIPCNDGGLALGQLIEAAFQHG